VLLQIKPKFLKLETVKALDMLTACVQRMALNKMQKLSRDRLSKKALPSSTVKTVAGMIVATQTTSTDSCNTGLTVSMLSSCANYCLFIKLMSETK